MNGKALQIGSGKVTVYCMLSIGYNVAKYICCSLFDIRKNWYS